MRMENIKDHQYLVTCSLFFYLYIILICLAIWSTETGLAGAGRHKPHIIDPWKEVYWSTFFLVTLAQSIQYHRKLGFLDQNPKRATCFQVIKVF